MISVLSALNLWLEAVEELPAVTDDERAKARKVLESAGLSLERVERGGTLYAIRKAIGIVKKAEEIKKNEEQAEI